MGYDLFLAHAKADKAQAEALFDTLTAASVTAFLDTRSIDLGQRWDRVIPLAQRASRATVVLVSRATDEAFYVGEEIATGIALHRERPDAHAVIPVFLDGFPSDVMAIPYGLRVLEGLDAVTSGGLPGVAARLRASVERWRALPPAPPLVVPSRDARCDPAALHARLCKLLESQFEVMVLYAGLDRSVIAGQSAPLSRRALDVVGLVSQGGPDVCQKVCAALERVSSHGA